MTTTILITVAVFGFCFYKFGAWIDSKYEKEAQRLNSLMGKDFLTGIKLRKIERNYDGRWEEFSDEEKIFLITL